MPTPVYRGKRNQHAILRERLEAIEGHQATIEDCVAQYPDYVELRELLLASKTVRDLPRPYLSAAAQAKMRQRAMATYRAFQATRRPSIVRHSRWLRLAVALGMVVLVLFAGGASLVSAAEAAVPGDGLYGLKRVVEQVQLRLGDGPSQAGLLYQLAQRRLDEVTVLAERRRSFEPWVLADLSQSLKMALTQQPDAGKRAALIARAAAVLKQAQSAEILSAEAKRNVLDAIREVSPTEMPTLVPTAMDTPTATAMRTTTVRTPRASRVPRSTPAADSNSDQPNQDNGNGNHNDGNQ